MRFWTALPLLLTLSVTRPTHAGPGPVVIEPVLIAGKPTQVPANGLLELPGRTFTNLEFHFERRDPDPHGAGSPRLLHRLEGVDNDWRDTPSEMRLSAEFFTVDPNVKITPRGTKDFLVTGHSAGWHGTVAASEFSRRTERFVAPPGATTMDLILYSGGPPSVVGVVYLANVRIYRIMDDGSREFISDLPAAPTDPSAPGARNLNLWLSIGGDFTMAHAERLHDRDAIGIVDNDTGQYSTWRLLPAALVALQGSATYELEWDELYSVGFGGPADVAYENIPPGRYRFRVAAATAEGVTTGQESDVELVIRPPITQLPWFWAVCAMAATALVVGGWRYLAFARLRRQHALETERSRIARDIHDDLGAGLTQIALLCELIRSDVNQPEELESHVAELFKGANDLSRAVDEIVWAALPANDTAEKFTTFIGQFVQDSLKNTGLSCRLLIPTNLPAMPMSATMRHHLYLAIREAVNNAIRHASATTVEFGIAIADRRIRVWIADDGRGIDPAADDAMPKGNGLANMNTRMSEIGGTCKIESSAKTGTTVILEAPL